jgi:hypothetical protein
MDYGALIRISLSASSKFAKQRIPFRQTARFIRGRIIDLLREQDFPVSQMKSILSRSYGVDAQAFKHVSAKLISEGLVVVSNDVFRLP